MKDYSKTIIYKIVCNITSDVYYGHTTLTLARRLTFHKTPSSTCCSKHIIKRGDYRIDLIEDYPCINKKEAIARERWWIENNECINVSIPGRTEKEWRAANREKLVADKKEYYENNKEQISINGISRYDWIKSCDGSSERKGLNQIDLSLFD